MGDCYDTSEFTNPNGTFNDGGACVMDCALQGSFIANFAIDGGYCYCEYMEMATWCLDIGNTDYYELW
jgi:hypothetical protein